MPTAEIPEHLRGVMESDKPIINDSAVGTAARSQSAAHYEYLGALLETTEKRNNELRAELQASETVAAACRSGMSQIEEHNKIAEMPSGTPMVERPQGS